MWGAIKKAINSNLNKSLDVLIAEKHLETNSKIDSKSSQSSVDAVKSLVQDGNNLIGSTNNNGGTATSGSIFAKLNKLLTDWTTTRAGYVDTTISSRASQTSIATLQNTVNTINGNTVTPFVMMKNPRLVHLGASVNKSEITVNIPLNVRVVHLLAEYSGTWQGNIYNESSNRTCTINGVALPVSFNYLINAGNSTVSEFGAVDKIFTSTTNFPFKTSYSSSIPYNVYALVCDI